MAGRIMTVLLVIFLAGGCAAKNTKQKYSPVTPKARIQGSFIQPPMFAKWGLPEWKSELGYLKDVGIDEMILQWTADTYKGISYYPDDAGLKMESGIDSVGTCLNAAKELGSRIWLGVNCNDEWWNKCGDEKWLTNEFDISQRIVTRLWSLYGEEYASTIAGFYIVNEPDNVRFLTPESQAVIAKLYKSLSDHIHTTTHKPVLISPYYNEKPLCKFLDAKNYARMWHDILLVAPIDAIAIQDGMGVSKSRSLDTVVEWLNEIRQAIRTSRPSTELWANVETMRPLSDKDFAPGDLNRVAAQVNAELPYVSKVICFSFSAYQSPNQGYADNYATYKRIFKKVIEKK